jgi:hypothetical protein
MDHKSFFKTLNAQDKARLNARSDVHGLRHLMLYCAALGVTGSWIDFALPPVADYVDPAWYPDRVFVHTAT